MYSLTKQQKIIGAVVLVVVVFGASWWLLSGADSEISQWGGEGTQTNTLPSGWKLYEHSRLQFTFALPPDVVVSEVLEGVAGDTVYGEGESLTFQMFVQPWDEPEFTVPTPERILQDLPSLKIESPQEVVLGDNTRALIFWSEDPAIGETREVWFIKRAHLYQVFAPAEYGQVLGDVFATLEFK